jgi:hypothetical protein
MVTSPEAIRRYLDRRFHVPPSLKGADRQTLFDIIKDATGRYPVFSTQPRSHQLEGLTFALWRERALLFYGMRLGKTKIALDWANHLKETGRWRGMGLVIAHAPIALDVWANEAQKHSTLNVRVIHHDVELLIETIANPIDLMVMTWSSMQQMFTVKKEVKRGKRKGEEKLYPDRDLLRLISGVLNLAVIDEIHECKNWGSLHFYMAEALLENARFRLGLTGTPFGRNPFDVWAQAKLIDGGEALGRNPMFFQEAFGEQKANSFTPTGKSLVFDKTKMPILSDRLAAISMSYSRSEVVQDHIDKGLIELRMHGAQRDAYNDCIDKFVKLEGRLDPIEIGNTFSRLRMIASGYLPFTDNEGDARLITFPEDVKGAWLEELFEEGWGGPMIIFHEYIQTGRHIGNILTRLKRKHVWLYGDSKDRAGLVRAFQNKEVNILVANSKSGGVSIDLNRADYMLYYESPSSPITRAQSEARPLAERHGRLLTMEDLICSPTEKRILSFIDEGKDLMNSIVVKRDYKALFKTLRV